MRFPFVGSLRRDEPKSLPIPPLSPNLIGSIGCIAEVPLHLLVVVLEIPVSE